MRRFRRWFAYHFQTHVEPARYNRYGSRILSTEEWEYNGGWDGALVPGWRVSRPDWWDRGARSSVTGATVGQARAQLDEWQEQLASRE